MSSLAIASILEELRCMDGELFKAEISQRLFLWLKSQAIESLEGVYMKLPEKKNTEYEKILDMYRTWSDTVCTEELSALEERAGGKEELNSVWVSVSMHWVRLHKKSDSSKSSVKIKTPDIKELLKNFFVLLCSKTWCIKGDLWSMDPMKQDFVFREVFRQSVGSSVHFVQEEETKKSVDKELEKLREELEHQNQREERQREERQRELEKERQEREREIEKMRMVEEEDRRREKKREEEESEKERDIEKEEEDDEIGPDDSVSHFFGGSRIEPPSFPQPPKRNADAGTVFYTAAPKRVLVKPITLKLENPVQSISEKSGSSEH